MAEELLYSVRVVLNVASEHPDKNETDINHYAKTFN